MHFEPPFVKSKFEINSLRRGKRQLGYASKVIRHELTALRWKHLIIEDHMQKAYQQTQDLYKIMTSCEIIACSLKRFVTTFEIKIIIIMTDTKSSLSINGWAGTSLLGCQDTQKSRSYQRHPTENVTTQINQKTYP